MKLRSALEPARAGEGTLISTTPAGYVLQVERDDIDVHLFDHRLDEARAALQTDPARSQVLINEALGVWHGRPFADLADEPFVASEIHRLDQRHLMAQRTRIEAALATGRHADVIGDLEALVAEHPVDESIARMLMVALQRSGRTADALRAFGEFRVRLGEELGIDPSSDLQELEAQLLTGQTEGAEPPRHGRPRRRSVAAPATTLVGRAVSWPAWSRPWRRHDW